MMYHQKLVTTTAAVRGISFCNSGGRAISRLNSSSTQTRVKSGDKELRAILDRMIRVDHAGEFGANRIYAGQLAVLGKTKSGPLIQHMWDQEKEHLRIFEKLIVKHRVRPTALLPLWNIAGYLLGAGTSLLGPRGAMACTVAVESVITEHYNNQIRLLMSRPDDPEVNAEILAYIKKCRDEEEEHHDTGLEQGAEQAPLYNLLSSTIKLGCRTAIWISERV